MRISRTAPVLILLAVSLGGCASSGTSGSSGPRNVLEAERLEEVAHLNALEAVQRLRPNWLRSTRGQDSFRNQGARGVRIYLNDVYYGEVTSLRNFSVREVREIRFLDRREATLRFGTNHAEGAIVITTHGD